MNIKCVGKEHKLSTQQNKLILIREYANQRFKYITRGNVISMKLIALI